MSNIQWPKSGSPVLCTLPLTRSRFLPLRETMLQLKHQSCILYSQRCLKLCSYMLTEESAMYWGSAPLNTFLFTQKQAISSIEITIGASMNEIRQNVVFTRHFLHILTSHSPPIQTGGSVQIEFDIEFTPTDGLLVFQFKVKPVETINFPTYVVQVGSNWTTLPAKLRGSLSWTLAFW